MITFGCSFGLLLLAVCLHRHGEAFPSPFAVAKKHPLTVVLATTPPNTEGVDPVKPKEQQEEDVKDENWWQKMFRGLAELSLQDYKWRSDVFKTNEADRMLEDSLARMRGAEGPNYVRPMDANRIGPLGQWEKNAVQWLSSVIDEEGRRAEKIVHDGGKLVRPKDTASAQEELGPLGFLEQKVTDFLQSIRNAEYERARSHTLRPKDMDESLRGPLGEAEFRAVRILNEIQESEELRIQQSKSRGGEIVRPIDVPGPLGEFEMAVLEIFDAEQKRARERERESGRVVRPMNAKVPGPLGAAESQAYETIQKLSAEENERLQSIKRVLQENRPMEIARGSLLGIIETILVGILRAPVMLLNVIVRVIELLRSETLAATDQEIIEKKRQTTQGPINATEDFS